jgi:glycosyltransferase involved in cell wall biosynthesis
MPFAGSPPFSDTHLPRALARRRPVLVIDPPESVHRWRLGEPLSLQHRLRQADDDLWTFRPLSLPGRDRRGFALASDPFIAAQIAWAARQVLPPRRALITFSPTRGWLSGVRRDVLVYWRRDAAAQPHYVRSVRLARARHRRLLRDADLVTAVSPELVEEARRTNPHAYLVPNGADVEHFSRVASTPDVLTRQGPVIGYLGAVSWRVDIGLLEAVARLRPEWTIALVGHVSVDIARLPNLLMFGGQPYQDLPGWAQAFDVGLVPYTGASFNRASFPLKVFDYLASGVPVVASRLPALVGLDPCVRLAEGPEGFVEAIDDMLVNGPQAQRCRELAARNSWDARAARLEELVEKQLDRTATKRPPA